MSPRRADLKGLWAIGVLALAATGCASLRDAPRTHTPATAARPAARNTPNPRQYYDQRAGRYYYFDTKTARYYWEDGTPKY